MKFCDKQEFFSEMAAEQAFYNHSFKARMLGYDSYFVSRYFYHLRMIEWLEVTPPHKHYSRRCCWGGISIV